MIRGERRRGSSKKDCDLVGRSFSDCKGKTRQNSRKRTGHLRPADHLNRCLFWRNGFSTPALQDDTGSAHDAGLGHRQGDPTRQRGSRQDQDIELYQRLQEHRISIAYNAGAMSKVSR